MPFLTPWMLFGLGAIGVPIIIHLWQRRRVVQIPFSTLRFLKMIAARTSRTSKIENLLLLLLRCLLFALIILATARPIMLAKTARLFGGDVPRTLVLIIDNSASMGYQAKVQGDKTRLDVAKEDALVLLNDLKQGDRVAVIAAEDRPELAVAEPTIDRMVARKAVEGIRQTESRGDFAAALREARKIAARADRGFREVFLFSDAQESAWRPILNNPTSVFDDAWKLADLRLIVVRPDDSTANNATVKKVEVMTPFLVPGSTVRGVATIGNLSTTTLHDLVQIEINGERVAQHPADAPPGGSVDIPFEFPVPPLLGPWVRGAAKLSGDNLPADDAFYFTIPVYQQPRVLIVEGQAIGPDRLRSGFFLRKALGAGPQGGMAASRETRVISAQQLDDAAIESFSVVFVSDPGRLSDRSAVRLTRFLESGGTVVIFPGDQTTIDDFAAMDFLPAKPVALRKLEAGRQPAKIVESTDPIFANAWDSETPFPALPQQKMLDWKLNRDAKVLLAVGATGVTGVEGSGLPFVIAGEFGAGRVLIVNASADRAWGDFPLSPAFLPLVQQIARVSATQTGHHLNFTVGEPVPMPPGFPPDKPVRITLPDGTNKELPFADRNRRLLEHTEQAGVYSVNCGDRPAKFAVNIDRSESDLHPVNPTELEKVVKNVGPIDQLTGLEALKQWLAKSRGLLPLWPILLVLALIVFAVEGVLSNVMARRRAQGDEQRIKTGRLNRRRIGVPLRAATADQMGAKS